MNQKPIKANHAKFLSYKLAHERMKAAVEAGFPLEAVAIAESLITDRLLSFINFYGADFDPEKSTLGGVAQKAAKICRETSNDPVGEALATKAEMWAKDRNSVLHAIAKSGQGVGPKIATYAFVEHAHGVAVRGLDLVKQVKSWHTQLLRNRSLHKDPGA